ncbi:hypothetical protein BP00DRAFT_229408 [Aspergillus indologenus CBS 114.80]|uniref:Uncharacterized protein n=1 Tax=Aspergillus indologenus CBS 114.80 TaxID=1450541 RepID=A0A2V5IM31_9EURO|nr:hypothetical protein BP00DRAFT_229408 [Aspergillus indologenus CBS 114.80]
MSTVLCTYIIWLVTPTYSLCLVLSTVVFLQGLQPGQVMTTNSDTKRISLTLPVSLTHSSLSLTSSLFSSPSPPPPPHLLLSSTLSSSFYFTPLHPPLLLSLLSSSSLLSPIPPSPSLLLPFLIIPSDKTHLVVCLSTLLKEEPRTYLF